MSILVNHCQIVVINPFSIFCAIDELAEPGSNSSRERLSDPTFFTVAVISNLNEALVIIFKPVWAILASRKIVNTKLQK